MDFDVTIVNAIGVIIAAIFTGVVVPLIKKWNKYNIVKDVVLAAEQLWIDKDKSGDEKLQYVLGKLKKLGVKITPQVEVWIQAFVAGLNGKTISK